MKSEKDEINSELKAKFAELFDEVTELKAKFAQQAERAKLKQLFDDIINLCLRRGPQAPRRHRVPQCRQGAGVSVEGGRDRRRSVASVRGADI